MLLSGQGFGGGWAKLARRSFYEDVPFAPGMVHEDVMALLDIVGRVDGALVLDQVMHAYVNASGIGWGR